MNRIVLLLLLGVSSGVAAQNQRVSKSVNDDGKTLSIQYEVDRNDQHVRYDRRFSVTGMSAAEKDQLIARIEDSLGVNLTPPIPPTSPTAPTPPIPSAPAVPPSSPPSPPNIPSPDQVSVTFRCETCEGDVKLLIDSKTDDFSYSRSFTIDRNKRLFPYQISMQPGDYKLMYYQNGVLQIQSSFTVKVTEKNIVVVK